jgi:hypothetical protein
MLQYKYEGVGWEGRKQKEIAYQAFLASNLQPGFAHKTSPENIRKNTHTHNCCNPNILTESDLALS